LCISHILSAIFHFIRPLHKIAKPFQLLNHLCTLPFLIVATLWRFCEGGIVCSRVEFLANYGADGLPVPNSDLNNIGVDERYLS
jgi:hypothetical protein